MKETRKGESREGGCNWLWIKEEHLLVCHPKGQVPWSGPHVILERRAPGILTSRPLSNSLVTLKFLAACPPEMWQTHTNTETHTRTFKPHPYLPYFGKTSSMFEQPLVPWKEISVFQRVEHKAITFILTCFPVYAFNLRDPNDTSQRKRGFPFLCK